MNYGSIKVDVPEARLVFVPQKDKKKMKKARVENANVIMMFDDNNEKRKSSVPKALPFL